MNWSIVGNHEIYIFPKAPTIWLALGCPGVKRAPNCRRTYLKMAAPSTCCLEVCQATRQKPLLLSFEMQPHFELTVPCQGDYLKSIQMSEDSSRSSRHRLWALSYYYTALEIAPLLKLQAYFGLQQNSVSLPQHSRVCVRVRDCRVHQKNNGGCFFSLAHSKSTNGGTLKGEHQVKQFVDVDGEITLGHIKHFKI